MMPANLCLYECCGLCAPLSSCGEQDVREEDHLDAEDPGMTEHRLRFLDYPYKCDVCSPGGLLSIREEPKVSVRWSSCDSREEWNAAFRSFVANNVMTDLRLRSATMEADEGPDFTILLQRPLKYFSVENDMGHRSIPSTIITALGAQRGLEGLTLFGVIQPDRLIELLNCEYFPNLRYLHLRIDKDVDFGKLPQLTVLRVAVSASIADNARKIVDIRSLTRLRALEVFASRAVVELGEDRSHLKWLHLSGRMEVSGDVSRVTHLLLGEEAKYDIVGRCPNLKQLSLCLARFDSPIAIPASVDRLFIQRCMLTEIKLPAEKELEVLCLYDITCQKLPPKMRARHLCLGPGVGAYLQEALNETDLGSPKSLTVGDSYGHTYPREDSAAAFLEFLLEQVDFRRDIQFLATNIALKIPLPPMRELRELCLATLFDVQKIVEIGKPRRLESLILAEVSFPVCNRGDLLTTTVRDVTNCLIVPANLRIPNDLGLTVLESSLLASDNYATLLWADYVERSTSVRFDVHYSLLEMQW